jgi:hypothetical protein
VVGEVLVCETQRIQFSECLPDYKKYIIPVIIQELDLKCVGSGEYIWIEVPRASYLVESK